MRQTGAPHVGDVASGSSITVSSESHRMAIDPRRRPPESSASRPTPSRTGMGRGPKRRTSEGDEATAPKRELWKSALRSLVLSRLVVICLQSFGNVAFPDLPTDAFKFTGVRREDLGIFDLLVEGLLGGLVRWDSVHFLNIALNGYIFENTLAFFPVYPFFIRSVGSLLSSLLPIHKYTAIVIAGVTVSNVKLLHPCGNGVVRIREVTSQVTGTCLLGLILVFLEPGQHLLLEPLHGVFVRSGHLFRALRALRSNGLMNFGYVGYFLVVNVIFVKFRSLPSGGTFPRIAQYFGKAVLVLVAASLIFFSVFRNLWTAVASDFCNGERPSPDAIAFADANGYALRGEHLAWCGSPVGVMPPYYSPIQKKYWDVEFFGYWKITKVPCFLLATPVIVLFFTLVLRRLTEKRLTFENLMDIVEAPDGFVPMVVHNSILILLGMTLFNVEILTRMLFSATPFLTVELSKIVAPKLDADLPSALHGSSWKKAGLSRIYLYFSGYLIGGIVLHANWGPFT
uniref:GPI mannosyltransferase 2 n=1 Tax=Steinernema glaseri TaxID=37863 RepID=A0A1I7ZVZ0_9BILA